MSFLSFRDTSTIKCLRWISAFPVGKKWPIPLGEVNDRHYWAVLVKRNDSVIDGNTVRRLDISGGIKNQSEAQVNVRNKWTTGALDLSHRHNLKLFFSLSASALRNVKSFRNMYTTQRNVSHVEWTVIKINHKVNIAKTAIIVFALMCSEAKNALAFKIIPCGPHP